MKWHIQSSSIPDDLAKLKQTLLANRQIADESEFFTGRSPFKISLAELEIDEAQLSKIKARLATAKAKQEQIIIFGDYDADGITATAVLWQVLHQQGYKVLPFIPKRLKHGYGLSVKALTDLLAEQAETSLIITVDNGIVAHSALRWLKKRQIDVIISDHHQRDEEALEALAVFHSTKVCGCAVAWFLGREISDLSDPTNKKLLTNLLGLVAIATVTDLMPLLSINRFILMYGLVVLRANLNLGLRQLFALAKIDPATIDTYSLGFQIGPRINAMGRLADGMDALRLLCTRDTSKAKTLGNLLHDTNTDRQNLTFDLVKEAESIIATEQDEKIIILSSSNYHEGIIGLIAGKMTEKFAKPSIVISAGPEVAKASARSLPGFNITEFIRLFRADLLEVGGHPLAAGFAIETSKIAQVKKAMQDKAREMLAETSLEKVLEIDCYLPAELLSLETIKMLESFAPFGLANPKPVFAMQGAVLRNFKLLGKEGEHLKLVVSFGDQRAKEYEVLMWRQAELAKKIEIGQRYDLVVTLETNVYRGVEKVQLVGRDVRKAPHV